MAGSYGHIVETNGALSDNETVNGMLENGGDVYEAIEEMYGMIWWLATDSSSHATAQEAIADARRNAGMGVLLSPTER